ncbi:MAG TPA: tetratricopeptide repeat protein, partial [Chthoniobacterales bacterium]
LAGTLYCLGDFETSRQHAMRGIQIWRLGSVQPGVEEVIAPAVACLCEEAQCEWHLGEIASSRATMAEAISLAKELNDMHALAQALSFAGILSCFERNPTEVDRLASEIIELLTRHNFAFFRPGAAILRGWARSALGDTNQGIRWIEQGIADFRPKGEMIDLPFWLALKAEALHLALRTSEALEAILEAETVAERSEERYWCAELHRLRGVFLAAIGAEETLVEASFCEAIRTAREQRSMSLATRAEASYAEYRCQRGAGSDPLTISLPTAKGLERSIAVLPFESLSDNRNDAYFADGVQDEILSNLARVSQLKVISRTSVMTYRPGGDRDLRSIASVLGVANVVEGTVRRDGNRVRITIRLVDARTDETLWSEIYDRSLTDIFAIQSDIAQKVATNLAAQLSPKERKQIREKPSKNIEAYDLYLQAKGLISDPQFLMEDEREALLHAIRLLDEATKKDSEFALAFCEIAKAHDTLYWSKIDQTPKRRAMADRAENEALRLRPDLAEVRIRTAWHYFVYREDERALAELAVVQQSLPNSAEALQLIAFIERRQGSWEQALSVLHKALILDPRHPIILGALADTYYWLRRYREVEQIFDRHIEFAPNHPSLKAYRASVAFEEKADLESYRAAMEKLSPSSKNTLWITSLRFQSAVLARDWKNAKAILSGSSYNELYFSFSPYSWANSLVPRSCHEIWLTALQRRHPIKGGRFGSARNQLKQKAEIQPDDPSLMAVLGLIDAAMGRKEEAIQEARCAVEMLPISKDAVEGSPLVSKLALVYAWTNEPDLAFQELTMSVEIPGGVHYGELKLDPSWDPLRKDPRFDKLLAELAPKD